MAADARLHRSYFGIGRLDWRDFRDDPGGIEFNLPISGWFKLFREVGFEVVDYLELQAPENAAVRYGVPDWWAKSWPSEHEWKLRRR